MPKHALKLLALVTIFSVAPVSAGPRLWGANAGHRGPSCPYERARLAALAARPAPAPAVKVPTTITLTDRAPSNGLLGVGGVSGFLNP
jgi:hypothetical protein